jgi:hypothetical protein
MQPREALEHNANLFAAIRAYDAEPIASDSALVFHEM